MPPPLAIVHGSPPLPWWAWVGFFALIALLLALDLGVFHRRSHVVRLKEALAWCVVWFCLAMAFNALVYRWRGAEAGNQFLAAYLVELSLSADNVFLFLVIFTYFRVEARWQHRVLFWGIVGAVLMRTTFILAGVSVIQRFHWVLYLFGAFIVYTGLKMAFARDATNRFRPERNPAVRLLRRFFPVETDYADGRFFVHTGGRRAVTTLFLVLLVVETTDVAFALDSIPAVLAITKSGFIALTSNIFAIVGLRSLYFAVSGVMQLFRYLKLGLAVMLVFIGTKMLIEPWLRIPTPVALGVIAAVIVASMLASALIPPKPALDPRERAGDR